MTARLRPFAVIAVAMTLVAACGGPPAVPELTDPIEILEAATTEALVQFILARHHAREDSQIAGDDRSCGFIAGGLNRQQERGRREWHE